MTRQFEFIRFVKHRPSPLPSRLNRTNSSHHSTLHTHTCGRAGATRQDMDQTRDLFAYLPPAMWLSVAPFLLLTPGALCNYRMSCRTAHYGTIKLVTDPPPFAGYNVLNCTQDCLPAFVHCIIQGMRRLRPAWKICITYPPPYGHANTTRITRQFVFIKASFYTMGEKGRKLKYTLPLSICRLTGTFGMRPPAPTVFQPQQNVALYCIQFVEHSYNHTLPCPEPNVTEPDTGAIRRDYYHALDYYTYYKRQTLQTKNKDSKAGYCYLFRDCDHGLDLELSLENIRKRLLAFSSSKQEVNATMEKKSVL